MSCDTMKARLEHLGIVTGLADFVNFVVAAEAQIAQRPEDVHTLRTTLFGPSGSLPGGLREEFLHTVHAAFPDIHASVYDAEKTDRRSFDDDLPVRATDISCRTVYGNLIHKRLFQEFLAKLRPDVFIFFDNGLSSYWDHDVDISTEFSARGLPHPNLACLSLSPPLKTPSYLKHLPIWRPGAEQYRHVFASLRRIASRTIAPETAIVVLGSSLFRAGIITWEQERDLYARLVGQLHGRGPIVFKAHPRATARPLMQPSDGVDVLETTLPVEALVEPGHVAQVVGMASTALITMPKFLGWKGYRIETEETRRCSDRLPHQRLAEVIQALQLR